MKNSIWSRLSILDASLKKFARRLLTVKSILIHLTWILASVLASVYQVDQLIQATRDLI